MLARRTRRVKKNLFQSGKASFRQLQQVRALVEPEVARLAATAITPANVERLNAAYAAERNQFLSLDERFKAVGAVHMILVETCGNPFLEGIVRYTLILTSYHVTITDHNGEQYHPYEMHGPIVEAVSAGDAKAAHAAMKKHVNEFGTVLLNMEKTYLKNTKHTPDTLGDL
jgi:GntR family transcriptional regulator, transcriptional repressor for pyruvate dehydrogenase complex